MFDKVRQEKRNEYKEKCTVRCQETVQVSSNANTWPCSQQFWMILCIFGRATWTDILLVITYWQMFVKLFVNPGLGDGVANGGRPGHLSWDRPTDGVGDLTGSLDGPNLTCQMGWPPTRGSARAAYPAPQKASASGSASASPLAIRWLARPTPYPRAWTPPATPTHQQQHWQ